MITTRNPPRPRERSPITTLLAAGVTLAYAGGISLAVVTRSFEWAQAVLVSTVLLAVTVPIARHLARADGDAHVFTVVMAAVVAKLAGSIVRYWVAYTLYGGVADANQYHDFGRVIAQGMRHGVFTASVGPVLGTGFLRWFTGLVYLVFGSQRLGGFLVYSWIAFVGLVLFWRAFRRGVPEGDARRYAILVLFLPSLLYWPSSTGKDAWMVFALGLTSYGVAHMIGREWRSLLIFALGILAITVCRPHVALCVLTGIAFAVLVTSRRVGARVRVGTRVVLIITLLVAAGFAIQQTKSFLGVQNLTLETVQNRLTATESNTSQGGSAFSPARVTTPLDFPWATITVLYRPFPFESHNSQTLLTSAEGLILLGITIESYRRLRSLPGQVRRSPYVAFAVGYGVAFIVAFSAFGNFGILARERVQFLPLFLVFLALPARPRRTAASRTPAFLLQPPARRPDGRA